jgi:hypothetical protein
MPDELSIAKYILPTILCHHVFSFIDEQALVSYEWCKGVETGVALSKWPLDISSSCIFNTSTTFPVWTPPRKYGIIRAQKYMIWKSCWAANQSFESDYHENATSSRWWCFLFWDV